MYSNIIYYLSTSIFVLLLLLFIVILSIMFLKIAYHIIYALTEHKFWSIFSIAVITIMYLGITYIIVFF